MSQDEQHTQNRTPGISFAVYVTGAFILTAVLAVLITASMVVLAWNINRAHFFTDEDLYMALLFAGVAALFISIVLGVFVGGQIVTPVRRISNAAKSIKEGDFNARTGLHGDDELYRLGETFDEMADAMQRDRDLERQLIGDVAHELRTPIMAVQATVEAIQDGVFEADEQRIATLSSESRRLGRLVDALLHLNRLENGITELKVERIDLSDLISGLVIVHEALVGSVGLTLDSQIDDGVFVDGDRDLIKQAIGNLVSNAVRYTPDGGTIRIILSRENGYARVAVSDTGIGISEEDLNHVYSRFWRADEARAAGTGGLGIGLSLVREVADQHHGSVSVESVLGSGSTFSISLPLCEDDPSLVQSSRRSSDERRLAREAKREQDRARKAEDKVRREQDRARKQAEKLRKIRERESSDVQQLTFFGITVPKRGRKESGDKDDSKEQR